MNIFAVYFLLSRFAFISSFLIWTAPVACGNPHSGNPMSDASNTALHKLRRRILGFFHANEEAFRVIMTSGATAAIRLVGESFPFTRESTLVFLFDNHTSCIGIRNYAEMKGAKVVYLDNVDEVESMDINKSAANLLVYPAGTLLLLFFELCYYFF